MGQSRGVIFVLVLFLTFVLPSALCAGVVLLPVSSILDAALLCAATGTWIVLLVLSNWWEFTTVGLRWVWIILFVAAAGGRALRLPALPLFSPVDAVNATSAVLAVAGLWALVGAIRARGHDGEAIRLSFPLRGGRFLVTDGGDGARSFLVNYHFGFGRHRAAGVSRSMRYAIDLVEIGPAGGESHGFLPRRNDAYRIWERSLYAPCAGTVVHVVADTPDNEAFGRNRPYGVGNHVVIRTGDVVVVLGHMRCARMRVVPGDEVVAGQEIGLVGNSGWTERPHLHMQAMRSPGGDWWHAEPVPMLLEGRFPVRNQVFRVPQE